VDIAKALAILSVPISHTLELDTYLRNFIFSFHMPLFFILSGFTMRLAEDFTTFKKHLKKNFLYLILPTIITVIVFILGRAILHDGGLSAIPKVAGDTFTQFALNAEPNCLGNIAALWFLVVLFIARTIMDFVNVVIKSDKNWIIFFLLGALGIFLGVSQRWLWFYVDVAFVATMFIEIGVLWRKYEKIIQKYTTILLLVSVTFWFSMLIRWCYIELYPRYYAGYELCVLEAVAGSFVMANLAMAVEETLKKSGKFAKKAANVLVFLGQNTLTFLILHSLDEVFLQQVWDYRTGSLKSAYFSAVCRLIFNVVVFTIFILGKKYFKILIKKRSKAAHT
jgi:fucose 4-O-acetylase-like acetyltransferase